MSLDAHIAILTHHSLAVPVKNKHKPNRSAEYYALLAFPPEAMDDLAAIVQNVTNGAALKLFEINIKSNADATHPIDGIPGEYLMVRASSQYEPRIVDSAAVRLPIDTETGQQVVASTFFAGAKVRAVLSAFRWKYSGREGVSFNLAGIMLVDAEAERLMVGRSVAAEAFAKYATGVAANSANPAMTMTKSPFVQVVNASAKNPFARTN